MLYSVLKTLKMKKQVIYFFLVLVILVSIISGKATGKNYYWEVYEGVIPDNAFHAGHGENETLMYIGQVLDGEKIIPGKIYANDKNIYYEFGEHGWTAKKNIMILCTDNPQNFKWIPTTVHDIHQLNKDTKIIEGGYEPNFLTFIGRIHLKEGTEVGKVICRLENECLALYTNENGVEREYHRFEILTYENFFDDKGIIKVVDTLANVGNLLVEE